MDKAEKFLKNDLSEDFQNVEFKTIDTKQLTEYKLQDVEQTIVNKFLNFVDNINQNESFFTYYRGDKLEKLHQDPTYVLNHSLNKFFIVGQKGQSYYCKPENFGEVETNFWNVDKLLSIVKNSVPLIEDFLPNDEKIKLKLLQAIVHNSGEEYFPEFKKYTSQFISTTVGNNNFNIAKNFISGDTGFIIFGFEKIGQYYINSEQLRLPLDNSEDHLCFIELEQEVMIEQVLWPSNIFGLFYINNGQKMFIINPWLIEKIKNNIDMENPLIYINQELFDEIYKKLGYDTYTYRPY